MTTITAELKKDTEVTISNGCHTWHADEPPHVGGNDTGPTPYDHLLDALAACTCITLTLYCGHKGLPLKSVSARYEHGRVHADDCADCEDLNKGFIEQIRSDVHIAGEFNDAQRKRLAQIVERCPGHNTLANGVTMIDRVEFS